MKGTTKAVVAAAVGVVTLMGAVGAYAGVFEHGGNDRRAARFITYKVDSALDEIKATDTQRQQVNQVKDQLLEEGKALKADMKAAHQELMGQWVSPKPDAVRVHQLIDQRADAFRAFAHKVADGVLKVQGLLTVEQRQVLKTEMERHHQCGEE